MKKVITLIVLIAATTISTVSFAGNVKENENNNEAQVKNYVISKIGYPTFAQEQKIEGDVYVSFKIGKDGKVEIEKSNATNQKLESYVVKKLQTMDLSSVNPEVGYLYNIKFSFKLY